MATWNSVVRSEYERLSNDVGPEREQRQKQQWVKFEGGSSEHGCLGRVQ